jgi:hypothetical protein
VSAVPTLGNAKFWAAIDNDVDVEVLHIAPDGDHRWNLNHYEKEHLRKRHAEGLI